MDCFITVAKTVATTVAGYTVAPIGRQIGYLIFYNAHFKELTDRVSDLESRRDEIKHLVEEERRDGKEIETGVHNWLNSVDGLITDANQLKQDPDRTKAVWSGGLFLVLRYELSRKATKMAERVVQEQTRGDFDRVAYRRALNVASIAANRRFGNFESRKSIKEDIMNALRDPKLSMIGVYGLGGVGKTTLVDEVAKIAKEDNLFDEVVKATVSRNPDVKTIQGEVAAILGLRFDEEPVNSRALRLHETIIKSEKTILIVLDDIWKRLDLEEVGIPSRGAHKGCKLLMASRNLDVLRQMGVNNYFRLEVLNDEETWSLFKENAGNIDDELIEIASQVAKKCGGLPVLIVTMARSLINEDIRAWKDALNWLERVDIDEEMKEITYSALEFTYKRLRGNEMKKLFLLCAVGEQPWISDLFKYGIGLGIFNNTSTLEGARNRLYSMISALKASCLLLEEDTSTMVKMHDVVREVAISIASRDEHMLIKMGDDLNEWPTVDFLRKCSQIHLDFDYPHICSKPPEILDCPNLELFHLSPADRSLELHDTIFERMENLKVMDLTGMNFSSLPTSFCFLTGLQTLCLDYCVLENTEAIGALKNLEILSLIHSSMIKLPSEIGKLTHLRMLDLSNSGIEVIPPNIISSLIKLEELYMGNTSIKWEVENSASQTRNASLVELRKLSNLTALELQVREAWMLPRDLMFEKLERYKIVIGDVWEWSDIHYVTLKTLKLKLGTDIHLEYWIKALTKRVENLYLDEVEGVSNVLYQLNREGFPQLKHLHIQNNAKIKHIIDSVERNHVPVSFPNLETLVIQSINNMEKICHGRLAVDSFANLRVIRVEKCTQLKYLFSFSMVKGLSRLSEIEVCQCNFMENVVLADNSASADDNRTADKIEFLSLQSLTLQHLPTLDSFFSYELTSSEQNCQRSENCIPIPFLSAQVSFPNLDTLKLRSLNLNKIWKDNQHAIHKITNLIVESCDELKYLFSSFMVGSFPNLIRLEISDCSLMEKIVASEERNHNIAASGEVRFSKLETIILKDMKSLKTIWHSQFDRLKTLQVQNCAKIVVVFPSSMQKTYHNLEKLVITDCALMEEIFTFTSNENCNVEDTARLKRITLERLPQLKQIWSIDPQGLLCFPNLEDVYINECGNLSYLFPLSVASNCSLLKRLSIQVCANMKEIIAQKEGSICTNAIFEFNQLNTLLLGNLPGLKGFYAENHTLSCPSLRMLVVFNCLRLNLFRTLSTNSNERFLDGKLNNVSVQQSPFIVEQVIPNLDILRTDQKHIDKILQAQNIGALFTKISDLELHGYKNEDSVFPDWFLQNIYTLKGLRISWSSFKTIFQDERPLNGKNCTQLKELQLCYLPELQHICEEGLRIDPVLEFVEHLHVDGCSSMINVVPSSVRFSHLRQLCILNCNGMINLVSSSTARSLAKLTTMKVTGCNSLQEIIAEKGDDIVYDIVFPNLKFLTLECLPRLNSFFSSKCALKFPLLSEVVVMQCPRLKNFSEGHISTPKLQKVRTEEDKKEWQWKGDLNGTIKNMFEDKVAFHSFKDLTLSEYPELKELWYGQLQQNVFRNLKNLVVHKCDFSSNVLFQPNLLDVLQNLEELDVRDCNSLEAVFDVKEIFTKETLTKRCTLLQKLKISSLPKLKHVWKEDPCSTLSFQNLCEVSVMECQSLKSLFPLSVARDIVQLQELKVLECGIEEIVSYERGTKDMNMIKFVFPHLTYLELQNLPELKSFCTANHSLQFNSLKSIDMLNCQKSDLFKAGLESCQEEVVDDTTNVSMGQPLFTLEEVSFPNLDTLKLRSLNLNKIWGDNQHAVHKLTNLIVESCDGPKYLFSSFMVESFPNLIRLEIRDCSMMENIIAIEERNHSIAASREVRFSKLETIILKDMKSLKTIWHSQFDRLKTLQVENCEKIVVVFPSSMQKTYHNLEKVVVTDCALVEEIFTFTSNENFNEEDRARLKRITLERLPKLKQTWSIDPQGLLSFHNLEDVRIKYCGNLSHLFPFSVANGCSLLKELTIQACDNMKEIIAQKEGSICTTATFEFNQLNTLSLENLPRLKGFYGENYTLSCPSLTMLVVCDCLRLNLFRTLFTNSNESIPDGKINVSVQQSPFIVEQVIPNLEILKVDQKHADKILQSQNIGAFFIKILDLELHRFESEDSVFPDLFLQNVDTLKRLGIAKSSFKNIFQDERLLNGKSCTQLKELALCHLPKLQHICEEGFQVDPVLEFVEKLHVHECSSMINIVPSSVRFSHLTLLEILNCDGMINLLSSPTARSLAKLTTMKVIGCNSLQEIIVEKGDDIVYDIVFPNLKFLMLECLPRLNSFCSSKCTIRFPLLSKVVVMQCPRLKNFSEGDISTPKLQKVRTEEDEKEWQWKGDLNGTIKNIFEDKVAFHSFKDLNLSKYPELKELWYGQLQQNVLSNLKNLVVHECDFLSNVLFQPNLLDVLQNLEELDVRDCNSLEAVFDVKEIFTKETLTKRCTLLKKLKISSLPKLKHVWKEDPCSTLSFQNLCEVSVMECQSLKSIFPLSVARDIVQLQELKVLECGIEEIVAYERGTEDMNMIKFVFPHLTHLQLRNLPELRSFCTANHSLQFISLKSIDVLNCQKLDLFKAELESCQEEVVDDIANVLMGQPLFTLEEVSSNLKELSLNGKDALMIFNGHCEENIFPKVELLRLQYVYETQFTSWNEFLEIFPSLVTLQVRNCYFETLFSVLTAKEVRELWLSNLEHLKHIWHGESPLHQLAAQNLEDLSVFNCPSLTTLMPSSMSFRSLNDLSVENCKGLIYLTTSSVAKSLRQLTKLKVKNCQMIENIIKIDDEEVEDVINFENLENLKLSSLSSLTSFCNGNPAFIFPSLVRFIVVKCHQIKSFSSGATIAPLLTNIEVENQRKWWKDDLDTTIEKLFLDKQEISHSNENQDHPILT